MPVTDLVPLLHVEDLERSIAFYEPFGFEVSDDYEQDGWLLWCHLSSGNADLMLALASAPVHAHDQAVLLYLYSPDLDALRADLVAAGVAAGTIVEDDGPGPQREMRVEDPDGNLLIVAQTG